jgi:His/Glu/Gln/Arg/opine family amino acid ABC transporter permease subunit
MEQLHNFGLLVYYLSRGVGVTLGVTVIALSTGVVFGTILTIMRVYGGPVLGGFAATYSMVIRGIPVIVVLFILFFVIAQFINLTPLSGWRHCPGDCQQRLPIGNLPGGDYGRAAGPDDGRQSHRHVPLEGNFLYHSAPGLPAGYSALVQ